MLELSDIGFKAAIIKMLQQAIANTLETKEKVENLSNDIEHLCKETERIKKDQMEMIKHIEPIKFPFSSDESLCGMGCIFKFRHFSHLCQLLLPSCPSHVSSFSSWFR